MTVNSRSHIAAAAPTGAGAGGCTPGAGHPGTDDAGGQGRWRTVRTHSLTGEWVALYVNDTAKAWTAEPIDTLVLQVHRDGRNRVVPAQLRDGALVLHISPRLLSWVPVERLECWLQRLTEISRP